MHSRDKLAGIVYLGLLMLSVLWLALIVLPSLLMAGDKVAASLILYQGFSAVCHQIPDRTYHLLGFPLGVCSRCTAIYAGFLAGLVTYPFISPLDKEEFPDRRLLILAGIPMALDFAGGLTGLFANTFLSRGITGFVFGGVSAFYLMPGVFSALSDMMIRNHKLRI
ncbi:MAG: DUF2085 domain-containing protein [Acidobacteria bacterium]|nr:DUF2085 domain-containing protein [Acidobacteriota bacterium]